MCHERRSFLSTKAADIRGRDLGFYYGLRLKKLPPETRRATVLRRGTLAPFTSRESEGSLWWRKALRSAIVEVLSVTESAVEKYEEHLRQAWSIRLTSTTGESWLSYLTCAVNEGSRRFHPSRNISCDMGQDTSMQRPGLHQDETLCDGAQTAPKGRPPPLNHRPESARSCRTAGCRPPDRRWHFRATSNLLPLPKKHEAGEAREGATS